MALDIRPGTHPHTAWIDLKMNGVLHECCIMKTDPFGNISFLETNKLDKIDKKRLVRILSNRNAGSFELWDLMSQVTLNNGVNALAYFHQLVRVITPQGVIMSPRQGEVGVGRGVVDTGAVKAHQQEVADRTAAQAPPPKTTRKSTAKKASVEEAPADKS